MFPIGDVVRLVRSVVYLTSVKGGVYIIILPYP